MKKTIILCVTSAVLGGLVAIFLYDPPQTQRQTVAQEPGRWTPTRVRPGVADESLAAALDHSGLTPDERINVAVYEIGNRSAVNIDTRSVQTDRFFMREISSQGEGSGTVIDRQGHILTSHHVVVDAREIVVTLFNGQSFSAVTVGADPATDIAVLKIDAPPEHLFPVTFGTSTGLRVGQRVFAIGNPFGLERTLTTGVVSSLERALPRRQRRGTIKSIIQIDAAINPGSSGGPLLDSHGRMIGMNMAIASRTGENAGVGFAVPVNTITRVVPELIENGRVRRPDLGVLAVYPLERGLLIAALEPGGAAERAGLQGPKIVRQRKRNGPFVYETRTLDRAAADLITAIDGKPVRSSDELLEIIEARQPGDEIVVAIIRQGGSRKVSVKLDADDDGE